VIAQAAGASGSDKCSVVLTAEHRSGALAEALAVFADHGINLSRIESRPVRARRRAYAFLVDFLGRAEAPDVKQALTALASRCVSLKWLGCYRAAARSEPGPS
jgi:prephenate dehydratase